MRLGALSAVLLAALVLSVSGCKSGPQMQFVPCSKGKDCPKCQGTGSYRCQQCLGRGNLQCNAGCFRGEINCLTCNGSGKNPFDSTGKLTCTGCNGRGKANCWTCNGSGNMNCKNCGGKGMADCGTYVPVEKPEKKKKTSDTN